MSGQAQRSSKNIFINKVKRWKSKISPANSSNAVWNNHIGCRLCTGVSWCQQWWKSNGTHAEDEKSKQKWISTSRKTYYKKRELRRISKNYYCFYVGWFCISSSRETKCTGHTISPVHTILWITTAARQRTKIIAKIYYGDPNQYVWNLLTLNMSMTLILHCVGRSVWWIPIAWWWDWSPKTAHAFSRTKIVNHTMEANCLESSRLNDLHGRSPTVRKGL